VSPHLAAVNAPIVAAGGFVTTIGGFNPVQFAEKRLHKPPSRLNFEEIDAPLIVAFLDDLEKRRGISVRSRNLRRSAY